MTEPDRPAQRLQTEVTARTGGTALPATPADGLDLCGTTVLVTGASGGIGQGIVARFVLAGARVAAHHRSEQGAAVIAELADRLGELRSELRSEHGGGGPSEHGGEGPEPAVVAVRGDLATAGGPEAVVAAAVARLGHLDVVVNNAGVQDLADLAGVAPETWERMLAVNLTAAQRCTAAFAAHRRERGGGGAVVHIASIEGHQPAAAHGAYAVSKAGLRMHARAAAAELGGDGIRVNVVSPGLIERPGLAEAWPEGVERWLDRVPLGRLGQPEDVGDACVALASPLLRFVTGAELVVDGGMLSRATW